MATPEKMTYGAKLPIWLEACSRSLYRTQQASLDTIERLSRCQNTVVGDCLAWGLAQTAGVMTVSGPMEFFARQVNLGASFAEQLRRHTAENLSLLAEVPALWGRLWQDFPAPARVVQAALPMEPEPVAESVANSQALPTSNAPLATPPAVSAAPSISKRPTKAAHAAKNKPTHAAHVAPPGIGEGAYGAKEASASTGPIPAPAKAKTRRPQN